MQTGRRIFLKGAVTATAALAVSRRAHSAELPKNWEQETDVIIIGAGIAGICAAIEAADTGARVVVLEKDSVPGGACKFSGGHMTVAGTEVEERAHVKDKPEWLYNDMIEDGEMVAVPELIREYVNGGREHIQWIERLGIHFADTFQSLSNTDRISPGVGRGHMIAESPSYPGGPHQGGLGVMIMLLKAAQKRGVTPSLNHTMTRVFREERGGPVLGIELTTNGNMSTIRARRAIVLTTGGWSGNLQMALGEDPRLTADIYPDCWPYHLCLGEGHIAAVDVGAELSNMSFGGYLVPRWGTRVYQIWEPPSFDTVPSIQTGVSIADFQRIILVKGDGRRFVNEMSGNPEGVSSPANPKFRITPGSYPNHPFLQAYLNLEERPRNVWAITDEEGAKSLGWDQNANELLHPNPKTGRALYPEMVAVADSLPALATRMQVNADGLAATIAQYNTYVDQQRDPDFGRPAPAFKISRNPFFAVRMALLKHTRRNGIRVNTRAQTLDRASLLQGENNALRTSLDNLPVIPRLYAAGECANYLGRYHSHGTLGIYSFFGRIAGRNAASETLLV